MLVRGTISELDEFDNELDDVYFEAEVDVIQGYPYIHAVDYYRNEDKKPCNVTDTLAHAINQTVKETISYQGRNQYE